MEHDGQALFHSIISVADRRRNSGRDLLDVAQRIGL